MRTRAKSSISCYVFFSSRGMETLCWLLFLVCELPSADCHALHSDALSRSFLVFSVCPPFLWFIGLIAVSLCLRSSLLKA